MRIVVGGVGSVEEAAAVDLGEDLADLESLCREQVARLRERLAELRRPSSGVPPAVVAELAAAAGGLTAGYEADAALLHRLHGRPLDEVVAGRRRVAELVRTRATLAAAVLVGSDWHSPSIDHSTRSRAGRFAGRVQAHHDDYKRDRHPDAAGYERRWLAELVDAHGHDLRALLTCSGMAAIATASWVIAQRACPGPVLLGRAAYHETRQLVQSGPLGDRVVLVDETDPTGWPADAAVVVVDSRCNSAGLPTVDVPRLLATLDHPVHVLLDTTASSVALQPWRWLLPGSPVELIVVESLTKYAQLGLDRTSAGVLVTTEALGDVLDEAREHLGTNIADLAVEQLPRPCRPVLARRLARIERNARIVADALRDRDLPLDVAHPGCGGWVAVTPAVEQPTTTLLAHLVKAALALAAERGVDLCEGASFGFDTTRLYLTAATTRYGTPFLRIAPGTEDALTISRLATTLADAFASPFWDPEVTSTWQK